MISRSRHRTILVTLALALASSGCDDARTCASTRDCLADEVCAATSDGLRCVAAGEGEGEGGEGEGGEGEGEGGEGEGEGGEGEGEGEGDPEPVITVRLVLVTSVDSPLSPTASAAAYAGPVSLRAEGLDAGGVAVGLCTIDGSSGMRVFTAPLVSDVDVQVTARCGANASASDDLTRTIWMQPLAAVAVSPPPAQTPGTPVNAGALVQASGSAQCDFEGDSPAARTGDFVVRCTRGEAMVQVPVTVRYTVATAGATLEFAADATFFARVTQQAAESCAVTCASETPVSVPVTTNGEVVVPFPATTTLLAGTSNCLVTCSGVLGEVAVADFAIHVGDIASAQALSELGAAALVGQIAIDTDLQGVVGNATVEVVTGEVSLRDAGVSSVSYAFPALRTIGGGLLLVNNIGLAGLNDDGATRPEAFPVLERIGDDARIRSNAALTVLSIPALTSVGGRLEIQGNSALTAVSLPMFSDCGKQLNIIENNLLTAIPLSSLQSVGSMLWIRGNDVLSTISWPTLDTVGGELLIEQHNALTTLSLPALSSTGNLGITSNSALDELDLSGLETVRGRFIMGSNAPVDHVTIASDVALHGANPGDDIIFNRNDMLCYGAGPPTTVQDVYCALQFVGDAGTFSAAITNPGGQTCSITCP